jgi:hypothetical protein
MKARRKLERRSRPRGRTYFQSGPPPAVIGARTPQPSLCTDRRRCDRRDSATSSIRRVGFFRSTPADTLETRMRSTLVLCDDASARAEAAKFRAPPIAVAHDRFAECGEAEANLRFFIIVVPRARTRRARSLVVHEREGGCGGFRCRLACHGDTINPRCATSMAPRMGMRTKRQRHFRSRRRLRR